MLWGNYHNKTNFEKYSIKRQLRDFPRGAVVKNPLANAGDTG